MCYRTHVPWPRTEKIIRKELFIMRRFVDEKMFNEIKSMLANGSSITDIATITNFSAATIYRINKTSNYTEYNKPAKSQVSPTQISLIGKDLGYHILQQLKEENELLKLLSNKLAFIVDELT